VQATGAPPAPAAPLVAIGVDGARAGWVAACLSADALHPPDASVWETRLVLARSAEEVAALRSLSGGRAPVAIDVPIGLPERGGSRACDVAARRLLGRRASCVFAPPARYMLEAADDYAAIRALVARRRETDPSAPSLSAQAAGIAPKLAEVDAFVRAHPETEDWLWECHPEVALLRLNGGEALPDDKRSAAGRAARLALVGREFPDAEARLRAAPWPRREVARADVLDAYAALSTALRCARGEQTMLGDGARDGAGVVMRMAV